MAPWHDRGWRQRPPQCVSPHGSMLPTLSEPERAIAPKGKAVDPDIRRSVRAAQMQMLFESALPGSMMATIFAFALAWHMRPLVPGTLLAWWLSIKCVTVFPRMVHGFLFERRRSDQLAWLTWGKTLLLLDGLAWGCAGVVLMPAHDVSGMTVVVATLSGIGAIAAFAIHAE